MRNYLAILLSVLISMKVSVASAYDFEEDGIYYTIMASKINVEVSSCVDRNASSITIPSSVKGYSVRSIGHNAFSGCSSLTSVTIPNSVRRIGSHAFRGCSSLTSVTIPQSVDSIGSGAFSACVGLASFTILNGVKDIDESAFSGCSSLTTITIPNSVRSIGSHAFSGCSSLTSITIPIHVKSIESQTFNGCTSLTSITIPESVSSIKNWAFLGCSSLNSVTIPESVEIIGDRAFEKCTSLGSVNIEYGVANIGDGVFLDCTSLTSIIIPESVKTIGKYVFANCTGLKTIVVKEGNPFFDSRDDCNAIIQSESNCLVTGCQSTIIPNSVKTIGEMAFWNCGGLTSITIPNSVERIGDSSFFGCNGLTSIVIPNSVTSIGGSAFYDSGLASIEIPSSITTIESYAFECPNLTLVKINSNKIAESLKLANLFGYYVKEYIFGDNVEAIGEFACSDCFRLETVTIGKNVWYIGSAAFDCGSLKDVYCYATQVPKTGYNNGIPFPKSRIESLKLHVPASSIDLYRTTSPWSRFGKIVAIDGNSEGSFNINFADSNVKSICVGNWDTNGDGELSENEALAVTRVGDIFKNKEISSFDEFKYFTNVTCIDEEAFSNCEKLTTISIPKKVTNIKSNAFYNCKSLVSISFPNVVKFIGDSSFYGCGSLTSVEIPFSVTTIGTSAFKACSGLESIEIHRSMTNIGRQAFHYTKWYENQTNNSVIYINNQVYSYKGVVKDAVIIEGTRGISEGAFYGCPTLRSLTIPHSLTNISDYAFHDCSCLIDVYCHAEAPPTVGEFAFSSSIETATLHVPAVTVNYFKNISPWNVFGTIVPIDTIDKDIFNIIFADANVKSICIAKWDTNGDGELSNEEAAAITNIGDSFKNSGIYSFNEFRYFTKVTQIGYNAFKGCALTAITIPCNVMKINDYAFNCSYLTFIRVEDENKVYDSRNECNAIIKTEADSLIVGCQKTIIPSGVKSIGFAAFQNCTGLTSINIPKSVTSIDINAFYGCSGLTRITIPDSVTSIGNYAFGDCTNLTSIIIPSSVKKISYCTFSGCI